MKPVEFIESVEGNDSRSLGNGKFGSTWDAIGKVWNIGPGLTHGITKSTVMTRVEIDAALDAELHATEAAVDRLVKVLLGENRRTVCVSLAYNIGITGFENSSVLSYINAGRLSEVPARLKLYNKSHGVTIQGLINRRSVEITLWNRPDESPAMAVPSMKDSPSVPKADPHPLNGVNPMATTPTLSPATSPVVAAATQNATLSLNSIWASIAGTFSSVAVSGVLGFLATLAPTTTTMALAIFGGLAALVSAIAHVYAIATGVSATNNATIQLVENFINTVETGLGGKAFTFDNNPPTAA